jgi:hypothetical protein
VRHAIRNPLEHQVEHPAVYVGGASSLIVEDPEMVVAALVIASLISGSQL